jgi:cytochrome c-type biogenesis protein
MQIAEITLGLAFLAGLASFLSPCVLSLVPAYVGYLGGRSVEGAKSEDFNRWVTFSHGVAFVLGFSIVFILLGVAASALGGLLYDLSTWIAKIGGIIVIIFGLHMIGVFRIPFLEYDLRPQTTPDRNRGYLSSALMGVFFSAGWSPCVGPVLGAILTLALNGGSIIKGVGLLTAYSIGLAIPFLLAALGIGWVTTILRRYGKVMRYVEIAMGILLVIVGVLLFLGTYEQIARFGFFVDLGL